MKPEAKIWLNWLRELSPKLLGYSLAYFGLPFILLLMTIRFASAKSYFLPTAIFLGIWILMGLAYTYSRLCGNEALRSVAIYSLLVLVVPGFLTVFCYGASRPTHSYYEWLGGGWSFLTMFWAIIWFCGFPGLAYPVMRGLKKLQFKVVHGRPGLFRRMTSALPRETGNLEESFADVLANVIDNRGTNTDPERIF